MSHFLADILHRHAALVHHDHHVIEYVVDLTDELLLVAVLGGDDGLRALRYLLEDLVDALLEQIAGVRASCGSGRRCAMTASICSNEFIYCSPFYFSSFSHRLVKKQVRCLCDRPDPWACRHRYGIIVTVGQDLLHKNEIARGLALFHSFWREGETTPYRYPSSAEAPARSHSEHEHLAAALILTDDRDERRAFTKNLLKSNLFIRSQSNRNILFSEVLLDLFYCQLAVWNRLAASAASQPVCSNTCEKCARLPQPPEAMTGMPTTSVTAFVSGRSKPDLVPSYPSR